VTLVTDSLRLTEHTELKGWGLSMKITPGPKVKAVPGRPIVLSMQCRRLSVGSSHRCLSHTFIGCQGGSWSNPTHSNEPGAPSPLLSSGPTLIRIPRALQTILLVPMLLLPCWSGGQPRRIQNPAPHVREVRLPVVDGQDLHVTRVNTEEGLSEGVVQYEAQDDQGFMWFGTLDGLNRYDGYEFKIRKHGLPHAELCGNTITSLVKDRSGKLWIGVDQCLDRFDPITENLTEYQHDPKTATSLGGAVYSIAEDHEGTIWLGTHNGLDRLDPNTGTFTHFRHQENDPHSLDARGPSNDIKFVMVDNADTLWVETSAGINWFDPKTATATRFPQLLNQDAYQVQYVFQDRSGRLWIHSREGSGIGTFNPKTGEFVRYKFVTHDPGTPTAERVTAMVEDEQGALWLGTQGSGLLKLDNNAGKLIRYRHDPADPHSLADNFVLCLYEDREGNIWAGGGGTNHFSAIPTGFRSYQKRPGAKNSLHDNFVLSVFKDSHDVLWVGNDGVLNSIDSSTGEFMFYRHRDGDSASISEGTVLSTVEDSAGTLWFASYRAGLNSFDRKTGRFRAYRHQPGNPNSPSSDFIMRLELDPSGRIWVASDHALDEFDPRSKRFAHYPEINNVLSAGLVTSLVRDHRGVLWFGTNQAGVVRFDPLSRRYDVYRNQPDNPATLSSDRVNALLVDSGGTLWVGTQMGLDRFDARGEQYQAYTEQDGLPSSAVEALLEDRQGNLWLGTDKGLAKFNPKTKSVRTYYASDGLAGNEFNYWGAAFADEQGQMFFPGVNGLTFFYPDKIRDNTYLPPVVLTDFRLFGTPVEVGHNSPLQKAIAATQALTLSHSQNVFSLAFSSLSYEYPERNLYRYKLGPLEQQWNLTNSSRRFATYTTLAPGNYDFRVQGSNNHGVWNETGASVRIRVLPPWWAAWWFRMSASLACVTLLWALYQLRLGQLARQFNMRLEERVGERARIARDLHDTLLQSFHGVMLHFQTGINLLPECPGEPRTAQARKTLENAMHQAKQAIVEGREAIQGLRTFAIESNHLALDMRTLGEELATGANPTAFQVHVEGTPRDLHPILRDEVYRITGEAIRNAFLHADAKQIEVEIHYDNRRLRVRVRDNGKGMAPKLVSDGKREGHFGLRGMRERAKLIDGKLTVWSALHLGTEVELSIPAARAYAVPAEGQRMGLTQKFLAKLSGRGTIKEL
jgi:ligand-binding sensor domain-containing protein/signal transduction histidine kinase